MKNLYAYSPEKELQHIRHVDKSLKLSYACLNCEGILIPRKGKVNAHHFAHKSEGNCSYETYLHKVAKLKFYYTYKSCLDNKTPFTITWQEKRTCNACQDIKGINISCDLEDETKKSDLTKTFDTISIEKKHNGFIADILLESSTSDKVLFIEFAVTHTCEIEKRNSGNHIIELQLSSDEDLSFLEGKSPSINLNIETNYGIPIAHKTQKFLTPNACLKEFEAFVIYSSHKVRRDKFIVASLYEKLIDQQIIYSVVNSKKDHYGQDSEYFNDESDRYEHFIEDTFFKGFKFKNCLTCRFSVYNDFWNNNHWFCKKLKQRIGNLNDGSQCPKHWMK